MPIGPITVNEDVPYDDDDDDDDVDEVKS